MRINSLTLSLSHPLSFMRLHKRAQHWLPYLLQLNKWSERLSQELSSVFSSFWFVAVFVCIALSSHAWLLTSSSCTRQSGLVNTKYQELVIAYYQTFENTVCLCNVDFIGFFLLHFGFEFVIFWDTVLPVRVFQWRGFVPRRSHTISILGSFFTVVLSEDCACCWWFSLYCTHRMTHMGQKLLSLLPSALPLRLSKIDKSVIFVSHFS